jgi:hypothetical protein
LQPCYRLKAELQAWRTPKRRLPERKAGLSVWINAMFGCCLRWPGAAKSAVALTVDGKTSNTVKALIK